MVDGVRSRVKPLAGVMHRDKQLGFIAQLNHMNRARPFLGMHLVDVGRTERNTPSRCVCAGGARDGRERARPCCC